MLTKHGQQELEFILMYLIKNNSIEAAYLLVHLASILMIYLSAAEVF